MDVSTSSSTPLGPITRARAKAIEDKVNSLLSELPLSTHETWLLPHMDTMCVTRYLEESHGTSTSIGQEGKATNREGQEEDLPEKTPAIGRPVGTGRPAPEAQLPSPSQRRPQRADVRPGPDDRPHSPASGRPKSPDVRHPPNRMDINESMKIPDDRRLLHRTHLADVRRHRTSGPP